MESDSRGWVPFASGTAALAACMRFARALGNGADAVALPAYGCPSLLAAAHFAGLEPRFIDLGPGEFSPDPADYRTASERDAALVVVDLFGVPVSFAGAGRFCGSIGPRLIHDLAQSYAGPELELSTEADCAIVSLGRGKPASLLGGGAAWCRDFAAFEAFCGEHFPVKHWSRIATTAAAGLYNLGLSPGGYALVASLPWLRLGETRLMPLAQAKRLPHVWLRAAATQLDASRQRYYEGRNQRSLTMAELAQSAKLEVPAAALRAAAAIGLNRLPVLCHSPAMAERLSRAGARVGVSRMYGRTLPEFLGMPADTARERFPNAYRLARQLVTLPTHSRINQHAHRYLRTLLRESC